MDIIQQIKERYNIQSLVSHLGLSEKNGFLHSIYKEDKTPSMKIFPKTNSFYDYSSSVGGDIVKFYQDYCRCDVKTAIKELCKLAGIDSSTPNNTSVPTPPPVQPQIEEKFNPKNLYADEQEYYYERLGLSNDENLALLELKKRRISQNSLIFSELYSYCINLEPRIKAINYLIGERKLRSKTLEKYKIFHIPDYYKVNQHMKKMFSLDLLIRSGLYNNKKNDKGEYKSNLIFYNHRIIIPYLFNDEITYLRGRYFDENDNFTPSSGSKYLGLANDILGVNTSKRFYNLDVLKTLLTGERVYITEGEFDTLVLTQEGFPAIAIPAVGNIPPEKQFQKLSPYTCVIVGDNDEAGNKMVDKLKGIFIRNNIRGFVKTIPAKDITDLRRVCD